MQFSQSLKMIAVFAALAFPGAAALAQGPRYEFATKITDVYYPIGKSGHEQALVRTKAQQVFSVPASQTQLISALRSYQEEGDWAMITVQEDKIIGVRGAEKGSLPPKLNVGAYNWYEPSYLASVSDAQFYMDRLSYEKMKGGSECWQRAEYWTHSLWRDYGLKTQKIFLFFTKPYREGRGQVHPNCRVRGNAGEKDYSKDYSANACDRDQSTFKSWSWEDFASKYSADARAKWFVNKMNRWDFHVAPLVTVLAGEGSKDYVLDPMFSHLKDNRFNDIGLPRNNLNMSSTEPRQIMDIGDWTNLFVHTQKKCVEVKSYAEAVRRKDSAYEMEDCLYLKTPMYYMGPDNLDGAKFHALYSTWGAQQVDQSCKAVDASGCGHWDEENERAK